MKAFALVCFIGFGLSSFCVADEPPKTSREKVRKLIIDRENFSKLYEEEQKKLGIKPLFDDTAPLDEKKIRADVRRRHATERIENDENNKIQDEWEHRNDRPLTEQEKLKKRIFAYRQQQQQARQRRQANHQRSSRPMIFVKPL